jgi:hypothetical protein
MTNLYVDLDADEKTQIKQLKDIIAFEKAQLKERVKLSKQEEKITKKTAEKREALLIKVEKYLATYNKLSEYELHLIGEHDMRLLERTKEFLGDE